MNPQPTSPVRVLVIGAGPASVAMHLPVLAELARSGEVSLAAVCDVQPALASAARQRFGFQQETGDAAAALARSDIDAVYIFGSAQMHLDLGLAALERGKHLFVEKPVAPSYRDTMSLVSAAERHDRVAVGGHNRRFLQSLQMLRQHAGRSRWRYAEAVFHKAEHGKSTPFGARSWLSANGIHALDALLYMMGGLPEQLVAHSSGAGGGPGTFSALMRWPDGAQGVFLCDNQAGRRREEYVFHGVGEGFRVTDDELIREKDGGEERTALLSVGDGIAAEHAAFLQAIRSGETPVHALANLAPSLLLAELIESGFSGRVELPAVADTRAASEPAMASRAILIVQPGGQRPSIAAALPGARLVSPADLAASESVREDIGAAILASGAEPLSAAMLAKMPNLRIVGVVGLSVAAYGPETLLARGIHLVNASRAYADGVAEYALALAILGRRRAFVSHELMRGGAWGTHASAHGLRAFLRRAARPLLPLLRRTGLFERAKRASAALQLSAGDAEPRELRGATAGLIGWSANACALAERLAAAGARVVVWSEHAAPEEIAASGAARVSLAEALAADIVSLHRGLTPQSRHFLGAPELAQLRPGSVLINIARGALIEPAALLERLRRRDVFACLDTFEQEPSPADDPLRALPNVFLSSHIAGGSRDMREAATREVAAKVSEFLAQGATQHAIAPQRLRTMS